ALIEVSTNHAVPKIIETLKKLNLALSSVKYVFVTHVHLDHSSGAGSLLKELPNAKLVVHSNGYNHMINPEKLINGAIAVYGKEVVESDYGVILPIDEDRVISCKDYESFKLGNRELITIETPGHARHHISIFDTLSKGIFTGDSFGLSYPQLTVDNRRFYQPTTTPTAFEFDKMVESIDKMMKLKPKFLFFTHYGIDENPKDVENTVVTRLMDYKKMVFPYKEYNSQNILSLEEDFKYYYLKECRHHGINLSDAEIIKLFDIDIKLNAMGLMLWRSKTIDLVI
ncbi:MAG: MBL fold metallo-hydrolase, partial [Spirochaetales bacterium]|nr:MBL fold metallo-hydrolase [Spirochaetales bacterium]